MFHVKHAPATLERFAAFEALLTKWNPRVNLISRDSLAQMHERHTLDSAQLFEFAGLKSGHWLDLGSGGGFPGIIIAIVALEAAPHLRVTCVESDRRKATFLATAARELQLPVTVRAKRIEDLSRQEAQIVSARALAPLTQLIPLARPHIAEGGAAVFPKGARHAIEIEEARRKWRFKLESAPSCTAADACLLKLRDIERV